MPIKKTGKTKNIGCRVTESAKTDFLDMCEVKGLDESKFLMDLIDTEWLLLEKSVKRMRKTRVKKKK